MDIVVGTYEQLLLGFRIEKDDKIKQYKFTQSFTDHTHIGCVKCMCMSTKGVLASGSTDETIQLLNLKKRVEMGSLVHHEGAVTDMTFHKSSHLFSVSDDGTLCVWNWRYRTWECLRTLKGHKAGIMSVSVHPTGKLALTVGKDNTLRTWNLVTGRPAYITNISSDADCVRWAIKGDYYAILYPRHIDVYETTSTTIHYKIESETTINAMVFCTDTVLTYSAEGGVISFHDISTKKHLHSLQNNTKRVKCLACQPCPDNAHVPWLIAASSNGSIKIWQLNPMDLSQTKLITERDTGFRIVCMAALTQTLTLKTQSPATESDSEQSSECELSEENDWSDEDEVITIDRSRKDTQSTTSHIQSQVIATSTRIASVMSKPVKRKSIPSIVKKKDQPKEHSAVKKLKQSKNNNKYNATTKFTVTKIGE